MERLTPTGEDELGATLRQLHVRSTVYCRSYLTAPWGFRVHRSPVAKFHLVIAGTAWLSLGLDPPVRLAPGNLVLVLGGEEHILQSDLHVAAPSLDEILIENPVDAEGRLRYPATDARQGADPTQLASTDLHASDTDAPGNGARSDSEQGSSAVDHCLSTELLCGGFDVDEGLAALTALPLPRVVVLDEARPSILAWMEPLLVMLRDDVEATAPGGTAILAKLADVFLTQALRTYLTTSPTTPAMRLPRGSPPIARAVHLIRERPEHPWTIDILAEQVGMSRSAFTTAFRAVMDTSPIDYLTRMRLALAAGYLLTTTYTIDHIARRVGYDNRVSLTKAFTRVYATTPAGYRRTSTQQPVITHAQPEPH
jgi:AraC-like DNA-binding protein